MDERDVVTPEPTAEPPGPPVAPSGEPALGPAALAKDTPHEDVLGGATWPHKLLSIFWNFEERRIRSLWRLVVLIVVVSGAGLAVRATGLLPERDTREFFLVGTAVRVLLAFLVVWLVGWLIDRRRFRDFGFSLDRGWWADLAFGLGLGAFLMTGIFLVEWALGWVQVTGTFRTPPEEPSFGLAILLPLALFVGVGILEELLARGYLLRNVAEGLAFPRLGGARGGLALATVISSILFALGHANNPNATWVSNTGMAP